MQEWTEIRRRVLVEGASKRSVCRDYGIAHKTLQKILANTEPPGYRRSAPRRRTKLAPYLPVIEEILASDREAPPSNATRPRGSSTGSGPSTATPAASPR